MADQQIKTLKTKRGLVKAKLTRFKTYLNEVELSKDLSQLEARLSKFQDNWNEFDAIQLELELIDETDDTLANERESIENLYFELASRANTLISIESPRTQLSNKSTHSYNESMVKLPTMKLPTFSGNYEEWPQFYELFCSLIDDNQSLSTIQKFHYLKSSLQDQALHVIESIEVSSSNYTTAWTLLKNRFDNKRVIINNHVTSLFAINNLGKESGTDLRNLLDVLNKHVRALNSLGQPTEQWDTLLIHIIVNKLDLTTFKLWENQLVTTQLPTFGEFTAFLEKRCNILESIELNRSNGSVHVKHSSISSPLKTASISHPKHQSFNKPSSSFVSSTPNCPLCKKDHKIFRCDNFLQMSISSRLQAVKNQGLCINCLSKQHLIKDCTSTGCKHCGKKHNTLLHFQNNSDTPIVKNLSTSSTSPNSSATLILSNVTDTHILMSTAVVNIEDINGKIQSCRVLLDSASQSNFITEKMVNKLNLKKIYSNSHITGIANKKASVSHSVNCIIKSQHSSYKATINCLVIPNITQNLPQIHLDTSSWKLPASIILADFNFNEPGPIDMLIGAELYLSLLCVGQIKPHKSAPIFQKTSLGWIASGKVINNSQQPASVCHLSVDDQVTKQVRRFWEIEDCDVPSGHNLTENTMCEQIYTNTTQREPTGRYVVNLPVKENIEDLGDSKRTAETRFFQLERKLARNPNLHQSYSQFMDEYEALGHMEVVETNEEPLGPVYYIPHLPVIREDSSTTKVRVVFDASANTTSGRSLNDYLMVGPTIQQDIFSILARFRTHKYVLTADIEKMYRQININKQQLDLQRIVWRKHEDEPLKIYRLKTVTYGTASAPFLAIRTLHQLAIDEKTKYPLASSIASSDFYVDDLMTGTDTLEDAKLIQTQMSEMLHAGGFNLRKWNSNSKELLETIPHENRTQQEGNKKSKVLGVVWIPETDTFHYTTTERKPYEKISKRSVLSEIASIFDPLGLVGPVILKFKLFMQELWKRDLHWDESLPTDMHTYWQIIRHQLKMLEELEIPRHATLGQVGNLTELHGFCDASEKAYGACVYIRTVSTEGQVYTKLLCSKSRVSPLQKTTIPRLELCAALLLAKLTKKLLSANISINTCTLWTDSSIVLAWITSPYSNWKVFVANRVKVIQELIAETCEWRHVRTSDNPADIISRGLNPAQILDCSLWWHGPEWLIQCPEEWPKFDLGRISNIPEEKTPSVTLAVTKTESLIEATKYSTLTKLVRVTGYCFRFIHNLKKTSEKQTGPLTALELHNATTYLIKTTQEHYMPDDYRRLKEGKELLPGSSLWTLQGFIGHDKLIRVGGRLKNADIKPDHKHPIVLPHNSHLTELILRHEHIRLLHAPPQLLLSSIRQKYWPLKGRDIVRRIVHGCIRCFKVNPKACQPQMGDLPADRLRQCRPFTNTGTDLCGPVYIRSTKRRNSQTSKGYIVIFVCLATKAIHLELVSDMTTDAFIAAFKRFVSRRGIVSNIYSDNGTNFVGADRQLQELRDLFQAEQHQNRIIDESSAHFIKWHFIPPKSPHFGGLWEAGVKSVKYHLRRVVSNALLTYEELYTTLTMIESCLNSRPLTPLSADPNDLLPLTPGHFLIGEALTSLPEPNVCLIPQNRLSHWQRTQQITQHFWTRWYKEYLSLLQQRQKWKTNSANIQPNQLVIIKDDNLPPLQWITGRVLEVYPGADNRVRVVTVKTSTGIYKRAANKLCILPVEPLQTQ